jgi:hypothetical protein
VRGWDAFVVYVLPLKGAPTPPKDSRVHNSVRNMEIDTRQVEQLAQRATESEATIGVLAVRASN